MSTPTPTTITLHRASHVLEVGFDSGETFRLPAEYLRVHSPSAEVQGHGPGQKTLVAGKANVNIDAVEPIGNYAVLLRFDDGHATGIFSWDVLLHARPRSRAQLAGVSGRARSRGPAAHGLKSGRKLARRDSRRHWGRRDA